MSVFKHYRKAKDVTKVLKTVRGEVERKVMVAVIGEPLVEVEFISNMQVDALDKVFFGVNSSPNGKDNIAKKIRDADLALVVMSPGKSNEDLKHMVDQAALARKKLVIVTGREISDWLVENLAEVFRVSGEDVAFIPISDREAIESILVPRIVDRINGKEIALAAALPIFKEEVVSRIINKTARQNAVIGVVVFAPGADMPLLTMNQIKMVLRLSAVYNQELTANRLYEILAVVGGGFAFREVARQVLGAIPVAGLAIKGTVAYGGTIAMGQLARRYFETKKGEIIEPLASNRTDFTEGGETESIYKSRT